MADNYDSPWKQALKRNPGDFLAFLFPQCWEMIDWRRQPRLCDKEINVEGRERHPHILIADLLICVLLLDGQEVLLHIEIEAQRDRKLAERISAYSVLKWVSSLRWQKSLLLITRLRNFCSNQWVSGSSLSAGIAGRAGVALVAEYQTA